mgnify:CR=1 FL=1
MAKRKRRDNEPGEFSDPLKNYNGAEYADDLERSLAEDQVTVIKSTPVVTITPDTTIGDAVARMAELEIGSVLVTEDDRLVGILSQRDVLKRIALNFDALKDQPIRDHMTPDPVKVYVTDPPAKALNLMAVHNLRHVPIVDVDDKVVGLLGPRRVTSYLREYAATT